MVKNSSRNQIVHADDILYREAAPVREVSRSHSSAYMNSWGFDGYDKG